MSFASFGPIAACAYVRLRVSVVASLVPFALSGALADATAQTVLPPVQVTGSSTGAIDLGLDTPAATGSRLGLSIRDTPASVTVITKDQIEERGITRLQDAAVRAPGLSSAVGGGNGNTAMTARGFSGLNSVVQLIDGTRLIVASGTIAFPVSPWPYESVEVLRGPASVLFGDGAIGGAVHYITRQPLRDQVANEAFVTAGSFDTARAGLSSRGPIDAQTAYQLSVYGEKSNGYIDRTQSHLWGYSGSLLYAPRAALTFQLSADGSLNHGPQYRGTPVIANQLDPKLRRANFDVVDSALLFEDHWLRAKTSFEATPDISFRNELYYLTSKRHFRDVQNYNYVLPAATQISRSRYVEIYHDQTQVGDRFDATVAGNVAGLKNKFVGGVEFYRTGFDHINNTEANGTTFAGTSVVPVYGFDPGQFSVNTRPTVLRASTRLRTMAAFIEDSLDLTEHWKLVGGARYDRMQLESTDVVKQVSFANRYKPLTGRLGLVWAPSRMLSLYAQASTATDPANGLLGSTAVVRETDLAKARQIEVGAKGDVAAVDGQWSLAAYRIEKRNLLAIDPVSGVTQQVGKQSSEGIEAALTVSLMRGWTIDTNVAILRARFDEFFERVGTANISRSGNAPPNVPRRLANVWTSYRIDAAWRAGIGLQYVGPRTGDNANLTHAPGYTLIDSTVSFQPRRDITFDLALRNLGNRTYAVALANNGAQWLLGAPRSVELTARYAF